MAISLVNNLNSLDSQSRLSTNATKLNSTIQRLSSGLRINSSGDDAAGLAIANSYRSDIAKLRQGVRNANDGVSTLQIIDGGLNTISGLLDRANVLATQAASDTFTGDRTTLQAEFVKVRAEITRQAENIGLGGATGTLAGRFNKSISVFIGGGTTATSGNNEVSINLSSSRVDTSSSGLSLDSLNLTTAATGTPLASNAGDADGLTAAETLTFTPGNGGAAFTVALEIGDTSQDIVAKVNASDAARAAGIVASSPSATGAVTFTANLQNVTVTSDTYGAAGAQLFTAAPAEIVAGSATAGAKTALTAIKTAISTLGSVQGKVGAGQNNLAQAIDLATAQVTNFQAAESRIRDADVAAEASDLARLTTLQQAGVAALAQANQASQAVLSLLR